MRPNEFKALRDALVAEKYNIDEIQYRVLNGDGASWIVNEDDTEGILFQLDPYHLSKSVVRNVYDKSSRRHIMRWLKEGQFEKVFRKLQELKYERGGVEKEVKNLTKLETYIRSNIGGTVSYRKREGGDVTDFSYILQGGDGLIQSDLSGKQTGGRFPLV